MAEVKLSGPISAIGSSSVKLARLVAPPDAKEQPSGGILASHAVPIEGADIRPVMDRLAARVGRVTFDPATGETRVEPGATPRLADLVDEIEQRHVEDLAGGCLGEPDEISVIGADPEPGSDQWFSVTIVEKLRKAKLMLGQMSEAQREGLGLLFEAAALHGRFEVAHRDSRLQAAIDNAERAGTVGLANARRSAEAAAARYAAALVEAQRTWAAGSRLSHVLMADRILDVPAFAGLHRTRLRAALKPHAPRK